MPEYPLPDCPDAGCSALELLRCQRVYVETYGCRYNFGDTAKLEEVLKWQGNVLVDNADSADAVIINTCTVVGPTERRMLRRLALYSNRNLYVTGCMPAVQRDAIFSVCTPKIIKHDTIERVYRNVGTVTVNGRPGIVQIASGCLGHCRYCITRNARGPLRSYSQDEVCAQVRAYASEGAAEIQLTAQDVSAWGRDTGLFLPGLIETVCELPGAFKIRLGMMNPKTVIDILDDLVRVFGDEKIFGFIHVPVQSGSDRILKSMGRDYRCEDFETIVAAFRRGNPGIFVATDVIVGYPGETGEDFCLTQDLITRIRPNKVNVTRYSRRPFTGTPQDEEIPDSVKKDRSRNLNVLAEQICSGINQPLLGTTTPFVVTESVRRGSVMARNPDYLGIVLKEELPIGFEGAATLVSERTYYFIGKRTG